MFYCSMQIQSRFFPACFPSAWRSNEITLRCKLCCFFPKEKFPDHFTRRRTENMHIGHIDHCKMKFEKETKRKKEEKFWMRWSPTHSGRNAIENRPPSRSLFPSPWSMQNGEAFFIFISTVLQALPGSTKALENEWLLVKYECNNGF